MTAFTEKVANNANVEFARFQQGKGRETDDPYCGYVGEYWTIGVKNKHVDGRTTYQNAKGIAYRPAWSSAFISFIMRTSGAQDNFLYSEAHIHYVVKAIRDAADRPPTAKFLGRDPSKYVPKVGDLINAGRGSAKGLTFGTVLQHYGDKQTPDGNFLSTHSDIVVAINAPMSKLITIGGNVATDTVGRKTWSLKADGTLDKGTTLICVVECLL